MHFVDRRSNPQGKSLPNRQRFLERAKTQIREAVASSIAKRRVSDIGANEKVKVRSRGTAEPFLHHGKGGNHDYVLPGNQKYRPGDRIPRPGEPSGGRGGSDSGEGEDSFEFTLTREEFLDLFFEELELPDLVKQRLADTAASKPQRAGFSVSGSPTSLNVRRTMRNSIGRRLALRRPRSEEIAALKEAVDAAVAAGDEAAIGEARALLDEALRRVSRIPFFDPMDIRYNRFEARPRPIAQAVMFCLMDVSGSMDEHLKDLAKRFFMLLHLFLDRKYEKVEVVFIRHTTEAKEVDEETFFRSRETGGTMVSSALVEALRIAAERYPAADWNLYVAQASDGDNFTHDNDAVAAAMGKLIPQVQYFAYIETNHRYDPDDEADDHQTDLWSLYASLSKGWGNFAMRKVSEANQIFGVLADLFAKNKKHAA
jgi:uncharacterized sporulation protein YeaH/YhbH (DUF444 family)